MLTEAELTILRAAANIAREDAIAMATNATTHDERESVNAGLSVYLSVEKYLFARDNADRPFLMDERREEREELVAVTRVDDPLATLIAGAFRRVCEAEQLIYAGGGKRAEKDAVIKAHSALLVLRDRYPVKP